MHGPGRLRCRSVEILLAKNVEIVKKETKLLMIGKKAYRYSVQLYHNSLHTIDQGMVSNACLGGIVLVKLAKLVITAAASFLIV